VTLNYYQA